VEEQLIQRAKQGDEAAFNALIDQHREVIFRYAYLIVRDSHTAEDVAQEAVLRIYRYLHRMDETRAFRPWALQITRNLARNHNRSWGRYKQMLAQFINGRETHTSDVEALTHAQQQAAHLHHAVSHLKADHQDVIYTRYFMGFSVEESAIALSIAEGTVKSRAHRALCELKALIEREFPQLREEIPHE
jgi:RNA polymerase sigma-70 factor, ECF subfamily